MRFPDEGTCLADVVNMQRGQIMKSRLSAATATVVMAGALLAPTVAWAADSPHCDAYSGHCPDVKPTKVVKPPTVVQGERITLPFTGGEIVLMTVAGAGALGAGTAFVIAGRRRRTAPPTTA